MAGSDSILTALPLCCQGELQLAPLQTADAAQLWPLIAENKPDLAQFLPWAAARRLAAGLCINKTTMKTQWQ